jgi:putative transposase
MINQAREEHPEMSIERLCELMSVSRSWYYARPSVQQRAHKDVELRDAIERGSYWSFPATATVGSQQR